MVPDRFQRRLSADLERLRREHRLRTRRTVTALSSTACLVNGQPCISFASNDYLGLAHHPAVTSAAAAVAAVQAGAGASPLVAGRSDTHRQLEAALAAFEQADDCVLFPSGFAANFGTLTSLLTPRDAVVCDRDNHASIIDACRASTAELLIYRHDALDRLRRALQRRRAQFDQVVLVTDAVFSMDGRLAPLPELADLAEDFEALLVVDEAHGTGVFGEHGRGVCELQQVEQRTAVRIGTLSKALGALGGFAAADQALCSWLWNSARSQFFSTALPPAVCAAAQAALQVLHTEPERRTRLHARCEFARQQLQQLRLTSVPGSQGPILPILLHDDQLAVQVSAALLENGWLVPAIRPPTVAPGTARLRLSLSSEHTPEQIAGVLQVTADILQRAGQL